MQNWALLVVSKIPPLDPNNAWNMKVLIPRDMGEITPKHEGNVGSHGMASKLFSYPIWFSIKGILKWDRFKFLAEIESCHGYMGKKILDRHHKCFVQQTWCTRGSKRIGNYISSLWISAYLTWTWTCLKCWNILEDSLTQQCWRGRHGKGDVTMIHPERNGGTYDRCDILWPCNIASTMSNRICHIASMGRSYIYLLINPIEINHSCG